MTAPLAVCVFCASRAGSSPAYAAAAAALARALHGKSWSLVYGGGTMGLMGTVAQTLHALGGSVHGVRVQALIRREVDDTEDAGFGRSTVVQSMHERKAIMERQSDAFVALPGGFGTLEELAEIITWVCAAWLRPLRPAPRHALTARPTEPDRHPQQADRAVQCRRLFRSVPEDGRELCRQRVCRRVDEVACDRGSDSRGSCCRDRRVCCAGRKNEARVGVGIE